MSVLVAQAAMFPRGNGAIKLLLMYWVVGWMGRTCCTRSMNLNPPHAPTPIPNARPTHTTHKNIHHTPHTNEQTHVRMVGRALGVLLNLVKATQTHVLSCCLCQLRLSQLWGALIKTNVFVAASVLKNDGFVCPVCFVYLLIAPGNFPYISSIESLYILQINRLSGLYSIPGQ